MIPLRLTLSGFLSYLKPVQVDFTAFDLACISGPNGAGKSSLLDAVTWALFGQARKRDDSLINARATSAQVEFVFVYESNIYRIIRGKQHQKPAMLEFHIAQGDENGEIIWKPLTGHSLRETESRIHQTLRLDYETFVNASFFLQGKADQFTQQNAANRKRILGGILGLEIWEEYRERARERRRNVDAEVEIIDARLREIDEELSEEPQRRDKLQKLQVDLDSLALERGRQEGIVENIRKIAAALAQQQEMVNVLARQAEEAAERLKETRERLEARCLERASYLHLLSRQEEINAAFQKWQSLKVELENWEAVARRYRQEETRLQGPRNEINVARARLEQEIALLEAQEKQAAELAPEVADLQNKIAVLTRDMRCLDEQLEQRENLNARLQASQQLIADLNAENQHLKTEMDKLKQRMDQLRMTEGAACPLCGQPLSPGDRDALILQIETEGRQLGDRFRANTISITEADNEIRNLRSSLAELVKLEKERLRHAQALAQQENLLALKTNQQKEWEEVGATRLKGLRENLQSQGYAAEAFALLAQIQEELRATGYDPVVHETIRQAELAARPADAEMRNLETARATLMPLQREIADLEKTAQLQEEEVNRSLAEYRQIEAAFKAAARELPNLAEAERALLSIKERENLLRQEVGAAQQKVLVLGDLRIRRKQLEKRRQELAGQVGQYRLLERAFSNQGIPAMLIEQALPEIENRANAILDRMPGGMSVRLVAQAAFKDRRREDLRETLDILVSDESGVRDYEMFSGGEAFRINFAVRLALAEVLAQRAGARLQTLFIDEGFGSQDEEGRQRLLEAIQGVQGDFAKILVITHLDELKDRFPARIEVEKIDHSSQVRVVMQ